MNNETYGRRRSRWGSQAEDKEAALTAFAKSNVVSVPQVQWDGDECPKCGKKVGRGKYLHLKWCNG